MLADALPLQRLHRARAPVRIHALRGAGPQAPVVKPLEGPVEGQQHGHPQQAHPQVRARPDDIRQRGRHHRPQALAAGKVQCREHAEPPLPQSGQRFGQVQDQPLRPRQQAEAPQSRKGEAGHGEQVIAVHEPRGAVEGVEQPPALEGDDGRGQQELEHLPHQGQGRQNHDPQSQSPDLVQGHIGPEGQPDEIEIDRREHDHRNHQLAQKIRKVPAGAPVRQGDHPRRDQQEQGLAGEDGEQVEVSATVRAGQPPGRQIVVGNIDGHGRQISGHGGPDHGDGQGQAPHHRRVQDHVAQGEDQEITDIHLVAANGG